MKRIEILIAIVLILALSVSQSKAMDNCERNELIERMSNDSEVIDFTLHSLQISLIHSATEDDIKSLPNDYQGKYRTILGTTLNGAEIIKNRYPELKDMDFSEKKALFEELNSSIMVGKLGSCYWGHLKTFMKCEGFNAAFTIAKYIICMAAVAAADFLAIEIVGPIAGGLLEDAVVLEHKSCVKLALFKSGSGFIGLAVCPGFFFENISTC